MIGVRVGEFKGIEVRKPDVNNWMIYDTSKDECFYWFGNNLYYKGISVAYIDGVGSVKDFKEHLFRKLQSKEVEEEIAESQTGEDKAGYEAPVSEESANDDDSEVGVVLRQAEWTIDDMLKGFDLAADRFMEETKGA